jgi:hypothetical protein
MTCADHVADPTFQLQSGGSTGAVDCTAHSCSNAIDHATCGKKDPAGRSIRLLSSEPIPNPSSPGLNLPQVRDVAWDDFGVFLDVRIGAQALTWTQYEARRLQGQGAILQVGYAPIADSRYDAGRGFRGNHAIFESIHATYDPLADGRAPGVFRHDGSVYDRALIRKAAGQLLLGSTRLGEGKVWAAFTRDVIPDYLARVPAGTFWAYHVVEGVVQYRRQRTTGGFSASSTPPRSYRWGTRTVTLVRLTSGSRAGTYISATYAKEL